SLLPSFFLTPPAPPALYTLSLHDALPICDERVVHDEHPRSAADSTHQRRHGPQVIVAVDACDAEADGGGPLPRVAERRLHDLVQDLFDLELPCGLQVGSGATLLGDDDPQFVGEQAHRLGAAGVDTENMHR